MKTCVFYHPKFSVKKKRCVCAALDPRPYSTSATALKGLSLPLTEERTFLVNGLQTQEPLVVICLDPGASPIKFSPRRSILRTFPPRPRGRRGATCCRRPCRTGRRRQAATTPRGRRGRGGCGSRRKSGAPPGAGLKVGKNNYALGSVIRTARNLRSILGSHKVDKIPATSNKGKPNVSSHLNKYAT